MSISLTNPSNNCLHGCKASYEHHPPKGQLFVLSRNVKFVVFVPESHSEIVRKVIGTSGGGVIGNYKNCSFTVKGIARFTECQTDCPYADETISTANEEKIETVVAIDLLADLIKKVRAVHPYKEMGYDLIPLIEMAKL